MKNIEFRRTFTFVLISLFVCQISMGNQTDSSSDMSTLNDKIDEAVKDVFSVLSSAKGGLDLRLKKEKEGEEFLLKSLQRYIIDYIGNGIRVVNQTGTLPIDQHEALDDKAPVVLFTPEKHIAYLRLPEFSLTNLNKLKQLLKPENLDTVVAVIWDFRFSQNLDFDMLKSYENFIEQIADISHITLVNQKTSGVFEIMIRILQNTNHCIIIGEATSGHPYEYQQVEMKNSSILLIPNSRYFLNNGQIISTLPCEPTIPLSDESKLDDLKEKIRSHTILGSDRGIQKAIELVTAFRLFGNKRF